MTQREKHDLSLDIMAYLDIVEETNDAAEAANAATDMVKAILRRSPKLQEHIRESWVNGEERLRVLRVIT